MLFKTIKFNTKNENPRRYEKFMSQTFQTSQTIFKKEPITGLYTKNFDSKPVTRAAEADDVDDNAWTRRLEPLC